MSRGDIKSEITIQEVNINGLKSLVRLSGSQEKSEAVVFVHGNPGSSEDWVDFLPLVGEFARVMAPDKAFPRGFS